MLAKVRSLLAAAVLMAPALASGDPSSTPAAAAAPDASAPDLRLHRSPTKLHMRVRLQDRVPVTTAAATKPAGDPAAGTTPLAKGANGDGELSTTYHPIPVDRRDLQERVIFKVNAGYQLDSAPASGATLRGGAALPPGFSNTRNWILGDAVLGTRDVLLPSLNGYFLASYQFDTSDTLATRTATIVPGDATGERVAIKAGYAEYGTEDKNGNKFWLRAGRQTRQDGGAMFAYFDGATIGYRDSGFAVSAFGGERVALYINIPTGTTFGGTFALDFKKLKNVPLKIGIDYQGLSINSDINAQSFAQSDTSITQNATAQLRQLIAATANIDLGKRAHLDLKLRVVDSGANVGVPLGIAGVGVPASSGGFQFGRASARLRVSASNDVMVVADVQQRGGGDLAYDLATPTAVDVVEIARQSGLGVGLYQPVDATTLGAQIDWRHGNRELLAFGRLQLTEGTVVTADQEGYAEAGAAIAGSPIPNTWITGQYTYRNYFLNSVDTSARSLMAQTFGDTSTAGLSQLHELALDGWWRSHSKEHQLRLGGGVFYRVYDLVTPYVSTDSDARGGGRADVRLSLTRDLHLQLAGEIAQSSPTLQREIGTMASVRLALEARW